MPGKQANLPIHPRIEDEKSLIQTAQRWGADSPWHLHDRKFCQDPIDELATQVAGVAAIVDTPDGIKIDQPKHCSVQSLLDAHSGEFALPL